MRNLSQNQGAFPSKGCRIVDPTFLSPPYNLSKLIDLVSRAPIEPLPWVNDAGVSVDVLRLDLLDPYIGGNKIFKLWGHLAHFFDTFPVDTVPVDTPIASFGGAYSNHLLALAATGKHLNLKTVAFVRGERPKKPSSTLLDLEAMGMQVYFIARNTYKHKHELSTLVELASTYGLQPEPYWIPEGGGGPEGLIGCQFLGQWLAGLGYSDIMHACGTGTTLAGICRGVLSANDNCPTSAMSSLPRVHGISALRSDHSIIDQVSRHLVSPLNKPKLSWLVSNQYHHGGFAKLSPELQSFMQKFYEETAIPTDRVYTGKVFYALAHMLQQGVFKQGSRVLVIHSGGLQGNRS